MVNHKHFILGSTSSLLILLIIWCITWKHFSLMVSLSVTYNVLSHPLNNSTSQSVGNFEYLRFNLFLTFIFKIQFDYSQFV